MIHILIRYEPNINVVRSSGGAPLDSALYAAPTHEANNHFEPATRCLGPANLLANSCSEQCDSNMKGWDLAEAMWNLQLCLNQ